MQHDIIGGSKCVPVPRSRPATSDWRIWQLVRDLTGNARKHAYALERIFTLGAYVYDIISAFQYVQFKANEVKPQDSRLSNCLITNGIVGLLSLFDISESRLRTLRLSQENLQGETKLSGTEFGVWTLERGREKTLALSSKIGEKLTFN